MSNYDETLAGFIGRIDRLDADIETIKNAAKDQCAELRQDIAVVIEEAVEAGIDAKALRVLLRQRRAQRKIEAMQEKLSNDELLRLEDMRDALGALSDLPLGQAALGRV